MENRQKRIHRMTAMLNDKEFEAIERYCKDYKIRNKAKFIRQMVFSNIIETYERDYPTLFSQKELAALVVEPR